MIGRVWAVAASCSIFGLLHCGGSVETVPDPLGSAGTAGRAQGGGAGRAQGGAATAGAGAAPPDAGMDAYVDPGCPDLGPPLEVNECDAFASTPSCSFGEGCVPFVEHPFGEGCGAQSFGTECRPVGNGRQGDSCGTGGDSCASGFVCVVGSQPGKRCVKLCRIGGQGMCPAGMICGELDVEGYGVCT